MQRPARAADTGTPPLVATQDPIELCRLIYQTVAAQMDATIFFLGLYDPTSQTMEVVWQVENGQELSGGSFPLRKGSGLSSNVVLSGHSVLIRHWSDEGPRVQVQYATATPGLPESAVAVPLKLGDHTIGLIAVQSYRPDMYQAADVQLLEALASDAAIIIAGLHYSEHLSAQVRRRVSELESVLASMADALLMIDPQGALVRINRAARELLSLDESSIVLGQAFEDAQWEQWPPPGRAAAQALRGIMERLQTTQEPDEVEVELPGPILHILSFRATPVLNADGSFGGGVIVFRDVTSERLIERFKDEMFSIASHDLRTPATVIKAQAQWLKRRIRQANAEQDVDEGLTMIVDQADRLSKLLNLLLDLSRIEAGHLELDLAPTDLRGILQSMARALQATTEAHAIEVVAPVGVIGHWDQRRIEEVVQNLLNNAVKYSPVGGRVEVSLKANDVEATVRVCDSGIGLDTEDAPHIFERFYRGGQGPRRLDGTGLGLYICRAIVTAHGGRIWAESNGPGRGSTFSFTLPLEPSEAAVSSGI